MVKAAKQQKVILTAAFRQAPIHSADWMLLVMKAKSPIDGKTYYFVDKCLPFGHTISCAIFQRISNALAKLASVRTKSEILNYLDDFFFTALFTKVCNDVVDSFIAVCKEVGMPIAEDKTQRASTKIVFLGLLLDTVNQLICIPVEKVEKIRKMLNEALQKKSKKITFVAGGTATQFQGKGSSSDLMPSRGRGNWGSSYF